MSIRSKLLEHKLTKKAATHGCLSSLDARGFTLIEILMALLLIGILTAVAIPQFLNLGNDAKAAVTRERLLTLKVAIAGDARLVAGGRYTSAGFELHCLAPPTTLADLVTQPTTGPCASAYDPFNQRGWRGPYVNATDANWNKDGWGTTIQYFVATAPLRTLRSCGPDLTCGNSDDLSVTY